ncbi:MAG: FAD-binding oxidoreductase, partial [Halobacteriales archaeon]|nr:FAD-binding oxidoreductase [Halobacteriales archaeon]
VNAMVDVSLPLRHTRGPILVLEAGDPIDLPYVLFESGAYFRGEGETKALAGRLAKEFDRAETLDPDVPPRVEEAFYRDVADRTGARIPALADATVVNDWLGLRTVTPDKRPILGPTAVDGFLVATGMSGLGVTLAPAVADRLADFLQTGAAIDDRLTASRFSTAD